ncbi:hypothetical protein, partial [Enterobacter cloacae]|uniref:hypothetical protein n=1 Tax=Enterobacter cloacae TaxID=550 RepID=UPI0013D6A23C
LLKRPTDIVGAPGNAHHHALPLPRDLFQPERVNSSGAEFGDRVALDTLLKSIATETAQPHATPLVDGKGLAGSARDILS